MLVAGTAAAVVVAESEDPAAAGPRRAAERKPTTTTTTTTATTAPALPAEAVAPPPAPTTQPVPPPPPREKTPIVKVGEIRIPKIGLVHPIYEGVSLTVVDHGPGHWPGSAMPGQLGNSVFAGHRVTHSHPFRNVNKLLPGDEIIFRTDQGEFRYEMTRQEIVGPDDTWIVNQTPEATVTLFACHPPGSARQRIVIRGIYTPPVASTSAVPSA
ncbi:MAG: class E sortase [Acidimicrobiia bacterium]